MSLSKSLPSSVSIRSYFVACMLIHTLRQLRREIHVIGCSVSLPSHLSSIILCLPYLTSKSTLLPLALPHLVSLLLNHPATAQTTIPLSLPTSTFLIIYFFLSSLHHRLWPLRLIALGPHSDNAKPPSSLQSTHHNLFPIITLLHFPSLLFESAYPV